MKYLLILAILTTGCQTHIEDRCLNKNLRVESLVIEDVGTSSHAKVKCYSKVEDNE